MASFKLNRIVGSSLNRSSARLRVPATVSAVGLILALSSRANAQDQTASDQTPLEEVVVSGIRSSLESAQAIKRNSEQVVDSVTAQDIGALPDRSVSEALQRIPGVTLQRTDAARDSSRLATEGGAVFVRGLSWVRSELNGRDVFSATDGRALGFEEVSADLLAGIDVYKNPQADMIEGGLGGLINLRTRLPFESTKPILAFSGDYNYADMLRKGFVSANGLYSNSWETGMGRVGALLSGSVGNVGNRTDSITLWDYVSQTLPTAVGSTPAGSTVYVPNHMGFHRIDWQQKRTTLSGAVQLQPSDQWQITLQAFQAKSNPHNNEFFLEDQGTYINNSASSYTAVNSSGVVTAGVVPVQPMLQTRYQEQHRETDDISINLKFQPTERLRFSGDLQYIKSHADFVSMSAWTQPGGYNCDGSPAATSWTTIELADGSTCAATPAGGYDQSGAAFSPTTMTFNIAGNNPTLALNQAADLTNNPENYWWYAAMDHQEDNDAHSMAERLDGEFEFEENPWLDSFRFGVRATDKEAITRETGWNWGLLSHATWGGGSPVYLNQSPASATQFVSYNDFMRGSVPYPGSGWFASKQSISNGVSNAYGLLKSTKTVDWGWTPLSTDWASATATTSSPLSGVNDQQEETYAGYLLLKFNHGSPIGKMDGNIGVRIVRTEEAAGVGYLTPGASASAAAVEGCIAEHGAAACQYVVTSQTFIAGGKQTFDVPDNFYTDVLPTLNLRFLLRDDLQLRFAVGKAMVRPSFAQMNPYTSLSFNFQTDGVTPAFINPYTGAGGNPDLKPIRANQFDTSLEWYFAPTGSLTLAAFYKDVQNFIYGGTQDETYTSNGVTQTFAVTRNRNGGTGKIQGFELGYQQFYDSLPRLLRGFGLQGNLTFVDSSGGRNMAENPGDPNQLSGANDKTLPLEGMSRWSYNAAALYEAFHVSARVAWNWRDRYLLTTSASNLNAPVWYDSYGQLDGEVFYSINDHLKIGLQGTNLLRARSYLDIGSAVLAPRYSWVDTDRRFAFAVRTQF